MGIQINGQTDTITATDGSLNIAGTVAVNVTGDATGLTGTPNITVGVVTASSAVISGDLTVNGTTTTLDTLLTEVDKLEVGANNTTVGVAITQSGSGDILRLYDGASQVVTVTDVGSVGIGTDNPIRRLHVQSPGSTSNALFGNSENNNSIEVTRTGSTASYFQVQTYTNICNIVGGPTLTLRTSDPIGSASTERLRITSGGDVQIANGNLVFSTAGTGIDFSANSNAAGMTSELLDDYEEGTFTPSFTGGTSGSGYTRQVGEYTKVGRLVTFILTLDGDGGLTGTATAIEIGGLPFTSRNVPENGGAQYTYPGNFDTTNDRRFWLVAQNNTTLSYRSATAANINGNLVNNVNSQFVLYGHYFTDS